MARQWVTIEAPQKEEEWQSAAMEPVSEKPSAMHRSVGGALSLPRAGEGGQPPVVVNAQQVSSFLSAIFQRGCIIPPAVPTSQEYSHPSVTISPSMARHPRAQGENSFSTLALPAMGSESETAPEAARSAPSAALGRADNTTLGRLPTSAPASQRGRQMQAPANERGRGIVMALAAGFGRILASPVVQAVVIGLGASAATLYAASVSVPALALAGVARMALLGTTAAGTATLGWLVLNRTKFVASVTLGAAVGAAAAAVLCPAAPIAALAVGAALGGGLGGGAYSVCGSFKQTAAIVCGAGVLFLLCLAGANSWQAALRAAG